jgi:electron transport complex protein RnfC
MRTIHDIHGGIHPPERKALSRPGELGTRPSPPAGDAASAPASGVPAQAIVDVGDPYLGGQDRRGSGRDECAGACATSGTVGD